MPPERVAAYRRVMTDSTGAHRDTSDSSSRRPEAAHDENESVVEVHLNDEFVESIGTDKAKRLAELVARLGREGHDSPAPAVREAFAAGLADISVDMNETEQERYVERICSGNVVDVEPPGHNR